MNFSHIILEGVDGIGKNTVMKELWPLFKGTKHVYCRGDLSNFAYALKYKRPFIPIQKDFNFLYVLLYSTDEALIQERILRRPYDNTIDEINKVTDLKYFVHSASIMVYDLGYNILLFDIKKDTPKQIAKKLYKIIKKKENQ